MEDMKTKQQLFKMLQESRHTDLPFENRKLQKHFGDVADKTVKKIMNIYDEATHSKSAEGTVGPEPGALRKCKSKKQTLKEPGPSLADHLAEDRFHADDVRDERTTQTRGRSPLRSKSVGRGSGRVSESHKKHEKSLKAT